MVVFRQSGCIWARWLYLGKSGCSRAKVVVLGQIFAFGQTGCLSGKAVVFGHKRLYSGESVCIGVKVVVFGQKLLYSGKSGCIRKKLVLIRQIGCIRPTWLYSSKVVVFMQK